MYYYQHHIGDFVKDTGNLTDSQAMAYLRLIWLYYDSESPLVNDPEDLAFSVRSDVATVSRLLKHYFTLDGNVWRHKRIDAEIAGYHKRGEKARNSANARWKNANTMRTHSDRNANASKNDANQEPITNNQDYLSLSPVKNGEAVDNSAESQEKTTRSRGSRLEPGLTLPLSWKTWAIENRSDLDPVVVFDRFRDYWIAKPGKEGTKLDWFATWRNWVRNTKGGNNERREFVDNSAPARAKRAMEEARRQRGEAEPGNAIEGEFERIPF